MEFCLGIRNFSAMAVSSCDTWRPLRKSRRVKQTLIRYKYSSYKVTASSNAGGESCVAVKENFADEEDYIKAGGSQLLFVQMQQNKSMDKQSKLSDKVTLIFFFSLVHPNFHFFSFLISVIFYLYLLE